MAARILETNQLIEHKGRRFQVDQIKFGYRFNVYDLRDMVYYKISVSDSRDYHEMMNWSDYQWAVWLTENKGK